MKSDLLEKKFIIKPNREADLYLPETEDSYGVFIWVEEELFEAVRPDDEKGKIFDIDGIYEYDEQGNLLKWSRAIDYLNWLANNCDTAGQESQIEAAGAYLAGIALEKELFKDKA